MCVYRHKVSISYLSSNKTSKSLLQLSRRTSTAITEVEGQQKWTKRKGKYSYSYSKMGTSHKNFLLIKSSVKNRDRRCCEQTVWTDGFDIKYKNVAQPTKWTKTTNIPQCHHYVVLITCASHEQGPQFKPAWWQHFFVEGFCTAFPASRTKTRERVKRLMILKETKTIASVQENCGTLTKPSLWWCLFGGVGEGLYGATFSI